MLRRSVVLAIAAFAIWRIAALGLSSHYAEDLKAGDPERAVKALAWNGNQPDALLAQATALREQDPAAAAALLGRAYAERPVDARPLIAAAGLAQRRGDQTQADALVSAAVRLMPSNSWIRTQAGGYWATQGDIEQAMRQWSNALEAEPKTKGQLFPVLLAIAEDPRTRDSLKPFANLPPSWWDPFFAEVAKRAMDAEPVRFLFALRRQSAQAPITDAERQAYVSRLKKDGAISEAYIEWVNGLNLVQRAQLGLIHDGGFELEPTNWGFDWHVRSTPKALVDRGRTYGVDGDKALHILFDRQDRRFAEVYQPLFLDPGVYRFSGRVRTDSLETQGGLKWTLRCLLPEPMDLGETERFLGSNEWRDFGLEFPIPAGCVLQEIRLVSAGERPFEHQISGGAWFDRMAIRRLPTRPPSALPGPARVEGPHETGAASPAAPAPARKPRVKPGG
jgi:tetratricopeptide (TPR) repeat protein